MANNCRDFLLAAIRQGTELNLSVGEGDRTCLTCMGTVVAEEITVGDNSAIGIHREVEPTRKQQLLALAKQYRLPARYI